MNNLIFILHNIIIATTTLLAARLGKIYLISLIAMYGVIANLFVLKQITLFGLEVTSSDVFIVGISLGLNLLQEKYDKKTAQNAIWISFFVLLTYTILSQFQIGYEPNGLDQANAHFLALLAIAPRLTGASLVSYLVSQTIDVNLYAYLKNKFENNFYLIRNYSSVAVSQLADTIIFSILGLAGLGYNLLHIIVFSYIIKLIAITLCTLMLTSLRKIIKT
jgi:uncharacterized integral membrane protein (TIGR00697 family)